MVLCPSEWWQIVMNSTAMPASITFHPHQNIVSAKLSPSIWQHGKHAIEKIADGTISHSVIYPREIIKRILALKAAGVVFVHNHPSGDTEPSREDKNITMKLATVLSSMDVDLLDHVIVGDNYHSMADSGYIASMNTRMRDLVLA